MVSLRYAWNLAHGDGLVWNPGERVEGTTSFLFTIYMTVGAFFLDKSSAALFVQITGISLVLEVALMARWLGRSLGVTRYFALITAAAVLAYYPLSYWSLMGMETGFLAALALAALLVAMRLGSDSRGSKLLGLLVGLMFATRPDAAVPAAVILAFRASWPRFTVDARGHSSLGWWKWPCSPARGRADPCFAGLLRFSGPEHLRPQDRRLAAARPDPQRWRFVLLFFATSRTLLLLCLSLVFNRDGRRSCRVVSPARDRPSDLRAGRLVVLADARAGRDGADRIGGGLLSSHLVRRVAASGGPRRPRLHPDVIGGALWAADQPSGRAPNGNPAYTVVFNRSTVEAGPISHYADPQAWSPSHPPAR
jgi:hypothetical protein